MMKQRTLTSLFMVAAFWATVAQAQGVSPQSQAADAVELNQSEIEGFGLRFVAATAAQEYLLATLPAVIAPPPNARIAVAATFPGVVLQTLAVEGDMVRRGQGLAVIASRDILALASDLAQAQARLAVAKADAERQAVLSEEGIVAGARAEEAKAELQRARAEVNEMSRVLAAVSADGAKGTYTLTAPIDGVVAVSKIETGEPIEGMVAAFVVDATDRYEVQAQVPERLVGKIEPGMRVALDGGVEAKVTSVGRVIQPETRSVLMKAAVTPGAQLVAGRTAMVGVYSPAPKGAVSVPRAAVANLGGIDAVFVRAKGSVIVRKVNTGPALGDRTVILSGLKVGEQIAVSNLSELKSLALAK